jgi:hypothetical protein
VFNRSVNRRQFIASTAAVTSGVLLASKLSAQSKPATSPTTIPADVVWHDLRDWGVEGRAFNDTENYFDRLPARARDVVRKEVWALSRDSTGMSVRFTTDADEIFVRHEVLTATLAMAHMPATGVSGLDLYVKSSGQYHYATTLKPATALTVASLSHKMPPRRREFLIHLPLYNGVKQLEIGTSKKAAFEGTPPRKDKPILFYGTSVTQGGCASRPGMAFTNILSRRLDRSVLNFGFSGNGRMEPEVLRFLDELDPAIYVLDCLANMANYPVKERHLAAVKLLREKHPTTPILFLEERPSPDSILVAERGPNQNKRCEELRAAYDELVAAGDRNLHYRKGDDLIGTDGEGTVDSSHPNDLGMMRYADALEPTLREILRAT